MTTECNATMYSIPRGKNFYKEHYWKLDYRLKYCINAKLLDFDNCTWLCKKHTLIFKY